MSKYFMFLLMVAGPVQAAQVCYSDITTTKPIASFQLNADGTVLDTTTKLMWSRCLVGQSWTTPAALAPAQHNNWIGLKL